MRGACENKKDKKWRAYVYIQKTMCWIGSFDTEEEAHLYAVEAEKKIKAIDPNLSLIKVHKMLISPDKRRLPWSQERLANHAKAQQARRQRDRGNNV